MKEPCVSTTSKYFCSRLIAKVSKIMRNFAFEKSIHNIMKKFLLSLFICCFAIGITNAQQTAEPESKSKTVEFLSKDGSFLLKDFLASTKVDDIDFQVLIITNIKDNSKIGCLRLTTRYIDDTYIGTLDADELEACIQCLTYIKDNLLNTSPANYTEVEYSTRDGVEFGAYYTIDKNPAKNKWHIYAKTKSYTWRSQESISPENLDAIIEQLQQARNTIVERIG